MLHYAASLLLHYAASLLLHYAASLLLHYAASLLLHYTACRAPQNYAQPSISTTHPAPGLLPLHVRLTVIKEISGSVQVWARKGRIKSRSIRLH